MSLLSCSTVSMSAAFWFTSQLFCYLALIPGKTDSQCISYFPFQIWEVAYKSWANVGIRTDSCNPIKPVIAPYTWETQGKCLKCCMIMLAKKNGTTSSSLHSLLMKIYKISSEWQHNPIKQQCHCFFFIGLYIWDEC